MDDRVVKQSTRLEEVDYMCCLDTQWDPNGQGTPSPLCWWNPSQNRKTSPGFAVKRACWWSQMRHLSAPWPWAKHFPSDSSQLQTTVHVLTTSQWHSLQKACPVGVVIPTEMWEGASYTLTQRLQSPRWVRAEQSCAPSPSMGHALRTSAHGCDLAGMFSSWWTFWIAQETLNQEWNPWQLISTLAHQGDSQWVRMFRVAEISHPRLNWASMRKLLVAGRRAYCLLWGTRPILTG